MSEPKAELGVHARQRELDVLKVIDESGGRLSYTGLCAKMIDFPKYYLDTTIDDLVSSGLLQETASILLTDAAMLITPQGAELLRQYQSIDKELNDD